jgi:phosphoadenosine phosphosulfate reductase
MKFSSNFSRFLQRSPSVKKKEKEMSLSTVSLKLSLTDQEISYLANSFENASPQEVLSWANQEFGDRVALATGFGAEGCVLIGMLAEINPNARFFYLDTGLLFLETYRLRDALEQKYRIKFERKAASLSLQEQAEKYGERLWERNPNLCCQLRKIEPLKQLLSGLTAWITAIRRDQSPARTKAGIIERDQKFGLIKINPLANWTKREVWKYIIKNDVPYNPLHDQGFPSIGCSPCTSPVQIGENDRSGRWRGIEKTECGLHQ